MAFPQYDPGSDPSALPRHTTPTWEVELLISGVAVFAAGRHELRIARPARQGDRGGADPAYRIPFWR